MATAAKATWGFRIRPLEFFRVARLIRRDAGNVALGARLFFSLGGHDEGPTYQRFLRSASGRRLVDDATPLPALLTDFERMRALPSGTLGREYVRELDDRHIDPLDLAAQTEPAYEGCAFTPEHAYVRDRVRNSHDLYHTLTGYGIDVIGEAGVLAFTFGQTGNKGWFMLVLLNGLTALMAARFNGWRVSWRGYLRGRRSTYLPAVEDWERLLALPLDQARAELSIPPLQPYKPLDLDAVFGRFAEPAS
jgi:ubiquinone biosynthesis protein COQ4